MINEAHIPDSSFNIVADLEEKTKTKPLNN